MRWLLALLRFLRSRFHAPLPEPESEPLNDPYARRPVLVAGGPRSRSGAVAIPEPDEEE